MSPRITITLECSQEFAEHIARMGGPDVVMVEKVTEATPLSPNPPTYDEWQAWRKRQS